MLRESHTRHTHTHIHTQIHSDKRGRALWRSLHAFGSVDVNSGSRTTSSSSSALAVVVFISAAVWFLFSLFTVQSMTTLCTQLLVCVCMCVCVHVLPEVDAAAWSFSLLLPSSLRRFVSLTRTLLQSYSLSLSWVTLELLFKIYVEKKNKFYACCAQDPAPQKCTSAPFLLRFLSLLFFCIKSFRLCAHGLSRHALILPLRSRSLFLVPAYITHATYNFHRRCPANDML